MEQVHEAFTAAEPPVVRRDSELSAEEIAAYVDGRLEGGERERVERILADDRALREEVVHASRLAATAPPFAASAAKRNSSAWNQTAIIFAAAAAVVIAFVPGRLWQRSAGVQKTPVAVASERQVNADGTAAITPISPTETSPIGTESATFAWHSVEGASYRLTVTDASGEIVLQTNTVDTVFAAPRSAPLSPGRYYWYVDALLADGSSLTSAPTGFAVRTR